MPFYDFVCENDSCSLDVQEKFFHMTQKKKAICECGKRMRQLFNYAPPFSLGFRDGFDNGAGQYFDTHNQKKEWIRKNNVELRT